MVYQFNHDCRSSNPVHLLSQLRSMFELDPLFTRTFLLALPLRDIATVLQRDVHIPLHEVAWTVTRVVEDSLPDEEVLVYLSISSNRRFLSRQRHPHSCNRITLLRHLSAKGSP